MPDLRFARLKTDPRFRKPRKTTKKVVVDDRFKSIFDDRSKNDRVKKKSLKVDKYGKSVSATHDADNLRRFYRLEDGAEEAPQVEKETLDYARGDVLMESSDEDHEQPDDSEFDDDEVVLGRDIRRPIPVSQDELEVDLDESRFPELDAQAAAAAVNAARTDDTMSTVGEQERTNRLAVVNLDWDHVRASHLFKIASSVISSSTRNEHDRGVGAYMSKGKVLYVRVYPSEFGKEKILREEKEGPPKELFKKRELDLGEEDINEQPLLEEDDGNEYNEQALRRYQLERLRYFYAIITCDTADTAGRIYTELDGTELERSANIFDLSFVPNCMTFDAGFRDEATPELLETYKGVEFVTDALRHSKVKLTWDDDDPERSKVTRRTLSRKEIDESDFKAYLASSSDEDATLDMKRPATDKSSKRDKMRELLFGAADEENKLLPEGWNNEVDKTGEMEITFTPGLSTKDNVDGGDETTLQQYLRKQKDKRKKRKKDRNKKSEDLGEELGAEKDDFFGEDDGDNGLDENGTEEDFAINVNDDRFKALHEDHMFAIDPTNPHFKKTKNMTSLLEERAKRQREPKGPEGGQAVARHDERDESSLVSLVDSIKRKSANRGGGGRKRRKL